MKKSKKYILVVIAGFFLLILLALLFTQSASFKEHVKNRLITLVEKQINLQLDIEELEGNLYSHLVLKNIKLSDNDSTVARIAALRLNYSIWKLTERTIQLDSFIIENPSFRIWQQKDSTWNFNSYRVEKDNSKQKKPFNFKLNARYLALNNGSISVSSFTKVIPEKTNNFNVLASTYYSKNKTKIRLQNFNLSSENPAFIVQQLSGIYTQKEKGISVDSLLLKTGGSNIDMNANYTSKEKMNSTIDASRVDNKELAIFIPSFKLLCSPSLKADVKVLNDTVQARLQLENNNQTLNAQISVNTLNNLLSKQGLVPYLAHLNFNNFELENWIETNNQHALIDGTIQLNGTNLLNPNSFVTISANLENSQYEEVFFDTLTFNGNYAQDSLSAQFDLTSDFGDVRINGVLNNISGFPAYNAQITSNNVDVSAFVPTLKNTKLNGTILVNGTVLTPNNLLVNSELRLNQSTFYTLPIDTLFATVNMDKLNLDIDTLQLNVPGASANASGTFNLDSLTLESIVSAHITSTRAIDSFYVLPLSFDSATTVTNIRGPINSLEIGGDVEIYNAKGYSSEISNADASYMVSLKTDSLNVQVNTLAHNIKTGEIYLDSAKVNLNYTKENMDIGAHLLLNDTTSAQLTAQLALQDTMQITIPSFEVKTIHSNYYLPDTLNLLMYNQEKIEIENFRIKDRNDDDFILAANGTISSHDSVDLKVEINDFSLPLLNSFLDVQDSLQGKLNMDMAIFGTAKDPIMTGKASIQNPSYGKYALSSFSSNFNYTNQVGFADVVVPHLDSAFYASVNIPFQANFDSLRFNFIPPESFSGVLTVDSLDLSTFPLPIPNDSISGMVKGEIEVKGDFNHPLVYGEVNISDGSYLNKNLGLDYNKIKTSVVFDGKNIMIDTVWVAQKGGLISLTGNVEFDSTIIRGNISSSSLQIDANNFFITKHRNYEVLIDANTFIKTEKDTPEFGGQIKVIRSDIYLPAVISDEKTDVEKDAPLLIEALAEPDSDIFSEIAATPELEDVRKSKIFEKLKGRINVEIPRNTWIKDDNMRVELSGDIDIVKTGAYFEIFGSVNITRGHYILYGRKLNVKESQIIFQGGEELDPILNVATEYVYRDSEKKKRYLELNISGKASEPDVAFFLDGIEITETDGISVLVFGATSDEIGYGDQNGLISSLGANAVAGALSAQLSRTVGTQLKLDMIEITATESWQTAAFVVGKYITNDIFIMYERGFGEVDGDEITPETITLEYEINDKLFLRLQSGSSTTSGVDIILKFEQEKQNVFPSATPKK